MHELTPWFVNGEKPAHSGVYEVRWGGTDGETMYQHWNGIFWGAYGITHSEAEYYRRLESSEQRPRWRGLTQNPEASHE